MLIHSCKYSTIFLMLLWITTAIAEDYVDIWCGLDTSTECDCGECGIIPTQEELDKRLQCAMACVKPVYTLTTHVSGSGTVNMTSAIASVDCSNQCNHSIKNGTVVTLKANPNAGHQFLEWQGTCNGTDNPLTLTISSNSSCTATFVPVYTLTVSVSGSGKVTSAPGGIDCGSVCTDSLPQQTALTLTATPTPGHQFSGWQGACGGTTNPLTVTLNSDLSCAATFGVIPPPAASSSSDNSPDETPSSEPGSPSVVAPQPGTEPTPVNPSPPTVATVPGTDQDPPTESPTSGTNTDTHLPVTAPDTTAPSDTPTPGVTPVNSETTTTDSAPVDVPKPTDSQSPQPESDSTTTVTLPTGGSQSPVAAVRDETLTPTTVTPPVVVVVECPATAIKSDKRDLNLTLGESAVKLTIPNMKSKPMLKQAHDSKIIDLKLPFTYENGAGQLELIPRAAGQTRLTISDCETDVTINIVVSAVTIPTLATCDPEEDSLALRAATQAITLHVGDPPLTTILAGGQGDIRLQPYVGEVATVDTDFSVPGNPRLTITPRREGEAQVVVEDCAQSQAILKIIVKPQESVDSCDREATSLSLQPQLVLFENETPVTLIVTGSQNGQHLTQAPNGSVVTLQNVDFLEDGSMRIILAPRHAGKTTLAVADCANKPVSSEIMVLKPNTVAYLCYFANKTDGVCANPDYQRLIRPNSAMLNPTGELTDVGSRFEVKLPISTDTVQYTVLVDENHWGETVDLLAVVMLTTVDTVELFTNTGETWDSWNGNIADLEAFMQLTLSPILETAVQLKPLSGKLTVYIGYRLGNGQIIFSSVSPIELAEKN